MLENWFHDGFKDSHNYGEEVLVNPTVLFIPLRSNLRAEIKSERGIKTRKKAFAEHWDRSPPPLFWDEYLISSEKGIYVFETRYVTDSNEILSIRYLDHIPERTRKSFLRKVPTGIDELVNKLVGKETETRKILQTFHDFVYEHEKLESPTTGKPIKKLLDEYSRTGYFYGNCKEARDFYMALCNAKGYPTKRVTGKLPESGGHVWTDVFVPIEDGYKLLPVDAIWGYFGNLNSGSHLFLEYAPELRFGFFSGVWNFVKGGPKENYKLKIEHIK